MGRGVSVCLAGLSGGVGPFIASLLCHDSSQIPLFCKNVKLDRPVTSFTSLRSHTEV